MKKSWKYFFVIVPALSIIIKLSTQEIKIAFVKLFNQNATFANYNSAGKMDGKVVQYVNGNVYGVGNLVNGIKQGWEIAYYPNGQIKSKTFFVNGLPSGKGDVYRDNGSLEYSGYYIHGNPYGDWYYYEHGKKKKYMLYDIKKNISFSTEYQPDGMINKKTMDGLVVSRVFFSINAKTKKVVIVNDYSKHNQIADIKDLMITIANPDGYKLSVFVTINGKKYDYVKTDKNTLKVGSVTELLVFL